MQRLSLVTKIGALIDRHGGIIADIPAYLWQRLAALRLGCDDVALHPAPIGCDDDLAKSKRCKVRKRDLDDSETKKALIEPS